MKDYDAEAREIYIPSIFSTPEWNEAEIQRITAILRKHDEAEAGGAGRELADRVLRFLGYVDGQPDSKEARAWILARIAEHDAKILASRPSREEEMREQIERIKHDCENALRSSTHHKCDYLSLIQSINDRLARAALAQGGARDDGHEPGELITTGHCPSCGASLEVMYGDDEGEIGILSTGMPEKSDISLVTCLGISLEEEIRRLRAALSASKPSRDETPDANDDILNRIIFDAQSWLTRSMDGEHDEVVPAYSDAEIKRRLIAWARPSREEEMREALIKAGRDEWFRDTTTISWSRIERALRAARAQGGARDEGEGEVKRS